MAKRDSWNWVDRLGPPILAAVFLICASLGSIYVTADYGTALFVALPFGTGVIACFLVRLRGPANLKSWMLASVMALALVAFCFIAFAIEGLICIVMASPIIALSTAFGAVVGYALFHHYWHVTPPPIVGVLL